MFFAFIDSFPGDLLYIAGHPLSKRSSAVDSPLFLAAKEVLSFLYPFHIPKSEVISEFEAKNSAIHLREISTKSWGVEEY